MFLVLWLKHPSTIPGTSLNVSTLHSRGLCVQLFLWGLSFHYRQCATRRPLHTIVSVWGIIETVTILYAWVSREYLTAVEFGPIIFHHQTRFGAYWNVCMFQVLSRSASFTVNSHFWHINSSIQPPLRVPLWLLLWVRAQASLTPPLIISMTLAFQWAGKHFAE